MVTRHPRRDQGSRHPVRRRRDRALAGVRVDARRRSAGRGAEPALEELAGRGPERAAARVFASIRS
ncbi:hypothetical protein [Sorangium cellulosum]|uniref:Uncharacterized protein n=1 Tax=Sorangium cellulosum TaxID=56 RepID=A0A150Q5X7_SORCE|nr:hypothetical protein [Sorangium cellulosum]KYF63371.1 hypothetical protein BE15_23105 [Sorangium cellulosum]